MNAICLLHGTGENALLFLVQLIHTLTSLVREFCGSQAHPLLESHSLTRGAQDMTARITCWQANLHLKLPFHD